MFPCILAATPASLTVPAKAVERVSDVSIVVSPNHLDWTYELGEPVEFRVMVLYDKQPLPGVEISYQVGPEKFEGEAETRTLEEGIAIIEGGSMEEPGFLRCLVTAEIDGKSYRGLATAAYAPLEIEATQEDPEDFEAFWKEQLGLLDDLPLDLEKTLVPEACTSEVNVYHISYQTWGSWKPSRFYGMLAEPKEPGRYPAILQVPGAGVRPYGANTRMAAKGAIVLQVGIHGLPVNLDREVYDSLLFGALAGYHNSNLDDPYDYYYRRVYLGCVRGNDVLTTHPMWDGETLVVSGGSQGGQLSIVTSSLDKRVTGLVSNYPAYCDVTGYLEGRAGGWPHMFRSEKNRTDDKIATSGYYDVVNFAKRLTVPGTYAWGYNDETCPPTSMFAAYNAITAPKELVLQLDMGHGPADAFNNKTRERVDKMAGLDD